MPASEFRTCCAVKKSAPAVCRRVPFTAGIAAQMAEPRTVGCRAAASSCSIRDSRSPLYLASLGLRFPWLRAVRAALVDAGETVARAPL